LVVASVRDQKGRQKKKTPSFVDNSPEQKKAASGGEAALA